MKNKLTEKIKELTIEEKTQLVSGINSWYTAKIDRLGIPQIVLHDGPHGVRIEGVKNTVYPNLCLLGCSFDVDAVYTIGELIGNDCIENGVDVLLAPGINLKRKVTGGRNFEYFSEDALLSGALGAAYVKGVQSMGTSATVKHFCCNNQEDYRMSSSSDVAEDVLYETYFRPFYKVIQEAKPDCIMTSYNLVNGEVANESSYLQKDILRKQFGFKGLIMSDWGAVVNKPCAIANGMDLEMPGGNPQTNKLLAKAVKSGLIEEQELNRAVSNVLKLVQKHQKRKQARTFDKKEIVSNIIADSIVLLKNEGILPLHKKEIIGVYGDSAKNPLIQGGGCAKILSESVESPFSVLSGLFDVVYVPTGGDLSSFKEVQKVLAFIGGECSDSESYDRKNIFVNRVEQSEINQISQYCNKVCAILQGGGALQTNALCVQAILACYYGGEFFAEGLVKVLCGYSPSGRLAETFPICLEHSPTYLSPCDKKHTTYAEGNYIGYKYYEGKNMEVAYPFGYGLSYADIQYKSFEIKNDTATKNQKLCGIIDLENNSNVFAKEVMQIYYQNENRKKLVWFEKVGLAAHEKKRISFVIDNEELKEYCDGKMQLKTQDGKLLLSKNARDTIFEVQIHIEGNICPTLDESMLIEDVYKALGAEVVKEYFSKPLGLAMYSNLDFVLPIKGELLSENEFEQNTSMMMPLKNLVAFSNGQYSLSELRKTLKILNKLIKEKYKR